MKCVWEKKKEEGWYIKILILTTALWVYKAPFIQFEIHAKVKSVKSGISETSNTHQGKCLRLGWMKNYTFLVFL